MAVGGNLADGRGRDSLLCVGGRRKSGENLGRGEG